ncbi:hypothetical protein EYF80_050802 [Liparis tanakae]|uniref:Uncharacterized protein n=1 Tax=Liparis tanakae TaxID=230148 RepID=A0A4Z2FCW6_9TELE|nr:hypothetical protein EYF80_050802 [Liparis tanakae]
MKEEEKKTKEETKEGGLEEYKEGRDGRRQKRERWKKKTKEGEIEEEDEGGRDRRREKRDCVTPGSPTTRRETKQRSDSPKNTNGE